MNTFYYTTILGLNEPTIPYNHLLNLRKNLKLPPRIFRLAPTRAINFPTFSALKPSTQNLLRCYAVASTTRSAVLTGRAAACVLGIPFITNTKTLPTIHLTLPGKMKPPAQNKRNKHATYTSRLLPETDIIEENGIRTTTITRTFVDLVALETDEDIAMTFIEAAFHTKRITKNQALYELKNMPAIHGKPRAHQLLKTARTNSESLYETKARRLIEHAQHYIPEITSIDTQVIVNSYRIDIVVNGFIAVEIDGRFKTRNNLNALENERFREKHIQNHGYIIIRYHPDEIDPSLTRNDIPNLHLLDHPLIRHIHTILTNHHKRAA
ncbi:hypothetical protein CFELI_11285 [Corynebacterium felinum]|uniref:Very-short-patch-repair endonuclease n=1 Tax=Corynebacterium felinum TaxID=131318 RepID=A0ABU2B6N1_9CORY|nr:hypothetical protein [Corynebacterium felinum]MDR7353669.1 very-short-patch-repair endonuclease [Corynebacterium felinum]WJY95848.1 hypothetical protein CFELI_11285 [Corynebacterium felinum]